MLSEACDPGASTNKAAFLLRTAALTPGSYELSAVLLNEQDQPIGQPKSFRFVRSDKRNPAVTIPPEGFPIIPEPQGFLSDVIWPIRLGVPLPINCVPSVERLALSEKRR